MDEKASFYYEWCASGAPSVDPKTLRNFVAGIGSTAMGIHPLRIKNKFAVQVSQAFVDFVLKKPLVEQGSQNHDITAGLPDVVSNRLNARKG